MKDDAISELDWTIKAYQGTFSLLLARCNYSLLRSRFLSRLSNICSVQLGCITLSSSDTVLYHTIVNKLEGKQPQALIVMGLDWVKNIEQMLVSADQAREEFRKKFNFPIVFLLNNQTYKKLLEFAPNLESWAMTTDLDADVDDFKQILERKVNQVLNCRFFKPVQAKIIGEEIEALQENFNILKEALDPECEIDIQLLAGFANEIDGKIQAAIDHYHKAINLEKIIEPKRQLFIWLNLAFCYYKLAISQEEVNESVLQDIRQYIQEFVKVFEIGNNSELVFFDSQNKLEQILRYLKDWETLKKLAQKYLSYYEHQQQNLYLAHHYGILAEAALAANKFIEARQLSQQALEIYNLAANSKIKNNSPSRCYFILGKAQQQLGEFSAALEALTTAQKICIISEDVQLYLDILNSLQILYFETKNYREAFDIKQESLGIEYQYAKRAFIGASRIKFKSLSSPLDNNQTSLPPEIVASGRENQVKSLIEKILKYDAKVIVIYGYSGVGKSSLINAGLIPVLEQTTVELDRLIPVSVRVYNNLSKTLGESLTEALKQKNIILEDSLSSFEEILQLLQELSKKRLRFVLIFDQFEEFFFANATEESQDKLFRFLGDCLKILSLKVIFSLRRDYLHLLLERPGMDSIGHDILSKERLYPITDFSIDEAIQVIGQLTRRVNFNWDKQLVEELVKDLAGNFGKVRPIELQIVGVQLQEKKILSLQEYQKWGKEALVRGYVDGVVQDCGEDNYKIAGLLLYLLTNEKETRPLKTRAELETELKELVSVEDEQLSLILYVLVGSGIVMEIPDSPEDKYQLVHDYLVKVIREQQSSTLQELVSQLNEERKERQKLQKELEQIKQDIEAANLQLQQAEKARQEAIIGTRLERQGNDALKQFEFQEIEALLTAMHTGKELLQLVQDGRGIEEYPAISPLSALRTILDEIKERNRLEGHQDSVNSASFSPDGKTVVTASDDKTARIWDTTGKQIAILNGHQDRVNNASFSPNGKIIVTTSKDQTVRIWDTTGKQIAILNGHQDKVNSAQFSPDGKIIITTSDDKTARIWDITGKQIAILNGHQDKVNSAQFSPNGIIIVTASDDKTARIWNTLGREIAILNGHQDRVNNASFSPDNKIIVVTASDDETARLWIITGNEIGRLKGHRDKVISAAFSPDGKTIVTASWDTTTRLWDTTGQEIAILKGHQGEVNSASFSPDGKIIVITSWDKTPSIWNTTGQQIAPLKGHPTWVNSASFSPDGKTIITASSDKTARIWDTTGKEIAILKGHQEGVNSVAFSPDGKMIVTASEDETVQIWDITGQNIAILKGHRNRVNSASFSPNRKIIVTASWDTTARIWDTTGQQIALLKGHQKWVNSAAFSSDGQFIVTASSDKTAKIWDITGKQLAIFKGHKSGVNSASFSPDGKTIVTASSDKTARIWDTTGKEIAILKGHQEGVNSAAFSPDGKFIVTASRDYTAIIWDTTGQQITLLKGHQEEVNSAAFSPDGKTIVTASSDKTARIWDTTGKEIALLKGHQYRLNSAAFSPDGKTLVTASLDKTAKIWPVESLEELLIRGCEWLRDYLTYNPNVREQDRALCQQFLK